MAQDPFELLVDPIDRRVMIGLSKLSLALKSRSWQEAEGQGLTPTQGQILTLLRVRSMQGVRLSELANALAITMATTSEAVETLVRKGLVQKAKHPKDGRAIALTLTETGSREADRVAGWPDFLLDAIDVLSSDEQTVLLRGLIKMIRTLQVRGQIPVNKMCITCRFFRPYAHAGTEQPHHCAFVDMPFGDRSLRLDCPDQEEASAQRAAQAWERFVSPGPHSTASRQET